MRVTAIVLGLVVILCAGAAGDVTYPFRNDKGVEYQSEDRRERFPAYLLEEQPTDGGSVDTPPAIRVGNGMARPFTLMTPIPSCEKSAQVMGSVCRWGIYYCVLPYPLPVGSPCCCPAFNFCGTVTLN